jgi:hypothetical protein
MKKKLVKKTKCNKVFKTKVKAVPVKIEKVKDPFALMIEDLVHGFVQSLPENVCLSDENTTFFKEIDPKVIADPEISTRVLTSSLDFFNQYFTDYLLKDPQFSTMYYKVLKDLGEDVFVKAIFNYLYFNSENSLMIMPMARRPFYTNNNEEVFRLIQDKAMNQNMGVSTAMASDEDFC